MAKLNDIDIEDQLSEAIRIEPLQIEEEFIRMPSDLAYWNERYARALRDSMHADMERHNLADRLRILKREELSEGGGKVTESMVEAAVSMDAHYAASKLRSIETEVEAVRLKGVVDAIRTKRDMLIQIGAHVRAEMEHDPMIREQVMARKRMKEGL